MKLFIPCIPIAQPRQRHRIAKAKSGATFVQNFTPTDSPVNAFKATLRDAFARHRLSAAVGVKPIIDGPVELHIVFVMPRPCSMLWKTKPMPRVPHTIKPDVDNLLKSLKDGLTGIVFRDDKQIWKVVAEKWIADGTEQPGVEIEILT